MKHLNQYLFERKIIGRNKNNDLNLGFSEIVVINIKLGPFTTELTKEYKVLNSGDGTGLIFV